MIIPGFTHPIEGPIWKETCKCSFCQEVREEHELTFLMCDGKPEYFCEGCKDAEDVTNYRFLELVKYL